MSRISLDNHEIYDNFDICNQSVGVSQRKLQSQFLSKQQECCKTDLVSVLLDMPCKTKSFFTYGALLQLQLSKFSWWSLAQLSPCLILPCVRSTIERIDSPQHLELVN